MTPWTIACQALPSMGILQARILEWVAMPFSRGSSQPRDRTRDTLCWKHQVLATHSPGKSLFSYFYLILTESESESRSVVFNSLQPHDCSLPDSSVHGILQVRILKWVAISFSRGSSCPRDGTQASCITGRFFTDLAMKEAQNSA